MFCKCNKFIKIKKNKVWKKDNSVCKRWKVITRNFENNYGKEDDGTCYCPACGIVVCSSCQNKN